MKSSSVERKYFNVKDLYRKIPSSTKNKNKSFKMIENSKRYYSNFQKNNNTAKDSINLNDHYLRKSFFPFVSYAKDSLYSPHEQSKSFEKYENSPKKRIKLKKLFKLPTTTSHNTLDYQFAQEKLAQTPIPEPVYLPILPKVKIRIKQNPYKKHLRKLCMLRQKVFNVLA